MRLAFAIAAFLRTEHQDTATADIAETMELMQLRASVPWSGVTDPHIASTAEDHFTSWDASNSPFYPLIDFHIAVLNFLIDTNNNKIDMETCSRQ